MGMMPNHFMPFFILYSMLKLENYDTKDSLLSVI